MKKIIQNKKKKGTKLIDTSSKKFYIALFLLFITSIVFIYSTYAWFSSTLDVQIHGFKLVAKDDDDFTISLDGINWAYSVNITEDSIINDLRSTYPTNTNRWTNGMMTVSTVGLLDNTQYKFSMFGNDVSFLRPDEIYSLKNYISPRLISEDAPTARSDYYAFDVFIYNRTKSPYSDNLYITDASQIFIPITEDDEFILSGVRFGMVYVNTVSAKSSIEEIQNMPCAPDGCKQFIYEPLVDHTDGTVEYLSSKGINIENDTYVPTYGVFSEGRRINVFTGLHNSPYGFNSNIFTFQKTINDFKEPIFEIPSGISKYRIYIWVEGEDIDVIQLVSQGYNLNFGINFEKDLSGYN